MKYPNRYATQDNPQAGTNPRPNRALKNLMAPIVEQGGIKFHTVCEAAGTSPLAVVRAEGFRGSEHREDMICFNYACGYCPIRSCPNAHLFDAELPIAWASSVHRKLEPGVRTILEDTGNREARGGNWPPNKRRRGGPPGGQWETPRGVPPEGPRWAPPGGGGGGRR